MNFNDLKTFLSWYKSAHSTKGYGIHSPLVFDLCRNLYRDNTPYYSFPTIEKQRLLLLRNNSKISVTDLGSGSKKLKGTERSIKAIARTSALPAKQAQILFKLVNYFNHKTIIELGTSLGLSTAYLASVNSQSRVHTFEGCPNTSKVASDLFATLNLKNITQHIGNIDSKLPEVLKEIEQVDFAYIDANHTYQPTLNYYKLLFEKCHKKSIIVLGDIYLNQEMQKAWHDIKQLPEVAFTIDNWHLGVVFFDKIMLKQHFKIRAL